MHKKSTILFSLLAACLATNAFSADLVFRSLSNSARVVISEQGDLRTNLEFEEGATITEQEGSLIFKHIYGGTEFHKVAFTQEHLQIASDLVKTNLTKAYTVDLTIHKANLAPEEVEQAIIGATETGHDGDLIMRGGAGDLKAPVAAVYYMDGEGVFEQNEVGTDPEFAYADITTPMGVEGRTVYEDGLPHANYYYIKDHLGSVRMTVDEAGIQQENVLYAAYGSQQDLRVSSEYATRERFTGKEQDKEGSEYCAVNLNIMFENFGFTPGTNDFTITYSDGSEEIVPFVYCIFNTNPPTSGLNAAKSFRYISGKTITQLSYSIEGFTSATIPYSQEVVLGKEVSIDCSVDITTLQENPSGNYYIASVQDLPYNSEGMGYCYFNKRYYDPDVGHFISTDPKNQGWNPYAYCGFDPINRIDPNGELWDVILGVTFAIGGAYLGGVAANDWQFNPGQWDWSNPGTYFGMIGGAVSGYQLGSGIGGAIDASMAGPLVTDPNEFGHAGAADNVSAKPLDRYPDPNDPTAQELNTRSGEYQAKKLPKSPYECSRYTGYEIEGKVLTPEQLTAKATSGNTLTITDPSKLDPKKVYAVTWQQADPKKIAELQAASRSLQHSGAYYDGYVWHTINGHYLTTEFNYLQGVISNAGYTIGPTFRLW